MVPSDWPLLLRRERLAPRAVPGRAEGDQSVLVLPARLPERVGLSLERAWVPLLSMRGLPVGDAVL